MSSTDNKGLIAEAGFTFVCLLNGFIVHRPLNVQLRYDFIVEGPVRQFKVQVKHGWKDRGAYRVSLSKQRRSAAGVVKKLYAAGDFDALAVFHPEERDFWIFPAADALGRTDIICHTVRCRCPHGFDTSIYWKRWEYFTRV